MENRNKWWNWPNNVRPEYAAWYWIVRRGIGFPFLWITASITFVVIALGWGMDTAKEFWSNVF